MAFSCCGCYGFYIGCCFDIGIHFIIFCILSHEHDFVDNYFAVGGKSLDVPRSCSRGGNNLALCQCGRLVNACALHYNGTCAQRKGTRKKALFQKILNKK